MRVCSGSKEKSSDAVLHKIHQKQQQYHEQQPSALQQAHLPSLDLPEKRSEQVKQANKGTQPLLQEAQTERTDSSPGKYTHLMKRVRTKTLPQGFDPSRVEVDHPSVLGLSSLSLCVCSSFLSAFLSLLAAPFSSLVSAHSSLPR